MRLMQHERPSRGFLLRPFWRDRVLAGVTIALGFTLSLPGGPLAGWPGLVVMGIGAAIFLAAVGHAIWSAFRPGDKRAA
jgi:hypothetical protein